MLITACNKKETADLIITNGKIITVDDDFSVDEAVAVRGDKIIFIGKNEEVKKYTGKSTRLINAEGLTVLPGLIDSHAHLISLGDQLYNLDISDCRSFDEVVAEVALRVDEVADGQWIKGGRWDHTRWRSAAFPVHDSLSSVSPDNPVYLKRVDGNSALVNKKALELAGITADTPDPEGGVIHRKANGEPSGVLINQAMNMVLRLIDPDSDALLEKKIALAVDKCIRMGLTAVHEAGAGAGEINVFKKMAGSGTLGLRVNAMLGRQETPVFTIDDLQGYFSDNRVVSFADDMLCVNRVKLFFDGALGSRGAAFFEAYDDDESVNGLLRITPGYITEVTEAALASGMSVATHCIGIRGNSLCLDAYEKALRSYTGNDHRLRIEHAQVVREEDIERFARLNIIPAMQATHCTSDKDMISSRIGNDRVEYAYAWRSFIDAGLPVPGGSDFPVETADPLQGIFAAVTRRLPGEPESERWHKEQCMTVEEAIKSYTSWAAYAGFQEDILGSLEEGKYADMTILDRDILSISSSEIPATEVVYTIIGGRIMYERPADGAVPLN